MASAQTLHCFPEFPPEVHLQIWRAAVNTPRVHRLELLQRRTGGYTFDMPTEEPEYFYAWRGTLNDSHRRALAASTATTRAVLAACVEARGEALRVLPDTVPLSDLPIDEDALVFDERFMPAGLLRYSAERDVLSISGPGYDDVEFAYALHAKTEDHLAAAEAEPSDAPAWTDAHWRDYRTLRKAAGGGKRGVAALASQRARYECEWVRRVQRLAVEVWDIQDMMLTGVDALDDEDDDAQYSVLPRWFVSFPALQHALLVPRTEPPNTEEVRDGVVVEKREDRSDGVELQKAMRAGWEEILYGEEGVSEEDWYGWVSNMEEMMDVPPLTMMADPWRRAVTAVDEMWQYTSTGDLVNGVHPLVTGLLDEETERWAEMKKDTLVHFSPEWKHYTRPDTTLTAPFSDLSIQGCCM